MKKHNEGYALVLVLVVITVLSLVAMAMLAGSLKNLQNQQKSIERMEAKYAAQGEIEKVIAGFENKIASAGELQDISIANTPTLEDFAGVNAEVQFGETKYVDTIDGEKTTDQDYLLLHLETTMGAEEHREKDFSQVKCTIKITGDIIKDDQTGKFVVKASNLKWEYVSYTITEVGGGGADET